MDYESRQELFREQARMRAQDDRTRCEFRGFCEVANAIGAYPSPRQMAHHLKLAALHFWSARKLARDPVSQ